MKILIAEDNLTNRKLLRAQLESEGYEVVAAGDGVEALECLERETVDAVISDVLMPCMDGYRLCYKLRQSKQFGDLPFIFYTNTHFSPSDEKLAREVGGDHFIQKPCNPSLLLEALQKVSKQPHRQPHAESATMSEQQVLREYNERLVAKLEERNMELAESEARFRAIFDTATDAIIMTDGNDKIVYYNKAAERMFGYGQVEAAGKSVTLLMPQRLQEEYRKALIDLQAESQVYAMGKTITLAGRRKDKTEFPFEVSLASWQTNTGKYFSTIIRDITERIRAEEERQKVAVRFRKIFEDSSEGIYQIAADGRYITINPAYARILGYDSPQELMDAVEISGNVCADPEEHAAIRRKLEQRGEAQDFQMRFVRKDRQVIWVSINCRVVYQSDGSVFYYEGSIRDITERKRLQEENVQAERLATIGMMASKLAHEVRNPLAAISLNLEMINEEINAFPSDVTNKTQSLGQMLQIMSGETRRIQRITQEYLLFGRQPTPQKRPTDLNALLAEHLQFQASVFAQARVNVKTEFDRSLSPVELDGDQITQAVMNLIRNALDAMSGGGTLTVRTRKNGKGSVCSVADTGVGMTEEQKQNLFKPFHSTKSGGTGLGLATVQQIVLAHGGRIEVESKSGCGTTFHLIFPPKSSSAGAK